MGFTKKKFFLNSNAFVLQEELLEESNKFDELRKKVEEMTEEDFDRMFPNL